MSDYTKKLVKNYKVTISVQNIRNEVSPSEIILSVDDNRIDLCMLNVPHLKTEGVALATQPPEIGDALVSLSAPAGIFHPPAFAILSGRYSGIIDDEQKTAMVTIPATGGSSGSGIINEDMELVGILFATHPGFNEVSLSSSYILMMQFIHEGFQIFLNSKN